MLSFPFLSSISFIRLRIVFEALDPIAMPSYKGSALRGCLGEALRDEVCTQPGLSCEKCHDRFVCPFSQLFNSFVPIEHPYQGKYPKSPHPYIIDPMPGDQTDFEPGDFFGFDLTLIGTAASRLPLFIRVFQRMGFIGIGKGRGRFQPASVMALTSALTYQPVPYFDQPTMLSYAHLPMHDGTDQVTLTFENPLRLKENGKLLLSAPSFHVLAERLSQRLGLLAHFYCGSLWPEPGWSTLEHPTHIQIVRDDMQEVDWRRYSGTQDRTMNFDGMVGTVTYKGERLSDWMPLLIMGSWLHVGSTATFGLGKYAIISS